MRINNIKNSNLSTLKYLYSNYREIAYPALKGIFESCILSRELSDDNDEILDVTASLLIKTHNDKTILPTIVDTIFSRNRKGQFNHDLIWTFFQARDPYSLMLIANYLDSENINDVKLAGQLLDFVPAIDMTRIVDVKKQYLSFFYYLKENYPFLYFTGESYQRTSNPKPYAIAIDAKYLCKRVSVYTGKPFIPLTKKENNLSNYFNKLDDNNKQLLSNFSLKIQYENKYLWRSWINQPIINQINIAEVNR
ncbi:hypothetical protein [Clostridium estertheticum]|uniref:Uncharacterized protein n=1 Tax=Clostridium estertheticum subsp. estertheticum TaxID=1552 RepID=A0A1J0GEP6_9CLOT|nr:hypothetical protein [Clostridium estertheticum]APC39382.1 hypothetical protein A7L45_04555 [Clostridium estertheticum subsp. estertheticum]MBZ9614601.1 hypothetical protein [Clostridium estertheticum subsp. laramiense]WAG74528.1 hypothetical protein LL032_03440 [Clostridium estertheticum]